MKERKLVDSIDESQTVWQSIENIVGVQSSLKAFWAALLDDLDVAGGNNMGFVQHKAHASMAPGGWVYTVECRTYRLEERDGGEEGGLQGLKGVLSVQIELWREVGEHAEPEWPHARTPLMYIVARHAIIFAYGHGLTARNR